MKTDLQLKQDVIEELRWEPSVNAAGIGVQVSGGVVTLVGQVDSYGAKWDAEKAAQQVAGVAGLAVELMVNLPGFSERTDADIARSVENTLEWTTYLPKDLVKVLVEKGWVTLSGQVEWEYQRRTAENAIRYLLGVTGVSNQIGIKPTVSLAVVRSDIEDALKRSAASEAKKIAVEVQGSSVTLSGSVHSWSERDTARQSAWRTPGVTHVTDNIAVSYY